MNLTVYVGPYIEASGVDFELIEKYEHLVTNGRGEAAYSTGVREPSVYVVPNVNIPGLERQLRFDRDEDSPVIEMTRTRIACELELFANAAKPFIDAAKAAGGECLIKWGVVCGVF